MNTKVKGHRQECRMGTSGSDSHVSEEDCLLRGMRKSCVSCPSKQTEVTDGRAGEPSQLANSTATARQH